MAPPASISARDVAASIVPPVEVITKNCTTSVCFDAQRFFPKTLGSFAVSMLTSLSAWLLFPRRLLGRVVEDDVRARVAADDVHVAAAPDFGLIGRVDGDHVAVVEREEVRPRTLGAQLPGIEVEAPRVRVRAVRIRNDPDLAELVVDDR